MSELEELSEPKAVLSALALAGQGRIFDLSSGWWPGMPVADAAPAFQVTVARSPRGMRAEKKFAFAGRNDPNYSFISEIVSTTMHAGTHLDAICHITEGPHDSWHGDHSAEQYLGDAGALRDDAGSFGTYVKRGVLLDIAAHHQVPALPDGYGITADDLADCAHAQGVEVGADDVVLLRTGFMRDWPDGELMTRSAQPGLGLEGARWLAERRPAIIGADNTSVEVSPSQVDSEPQPVHRFLIRQAGIRLLEWVDLEQLAAARAYTFCFICLPLTIKGATGSLVRPIAIA